MATTTYGSVQVNDSAISVLLSRLASLLKRPAERSSWADTVIGL